MLPLLLTISSLHRYNERRASLLLSSLVTLPFTVATVTTRTLSLAIIFLLQPLSWLLMLLLTLATVNLAIRLACRYFSSLLPSCPGGA